MRILHTSDWHIGRTLYGRNRYEEFHAFLTWLSDTIEQQSVDVLLVAGDVFDTSTPSNHAQGLYYRFLCHVAASSCRHVIITAGNHDSPSFLNAPKELLKAINVHVVGATTDSVEDEVLVLHNHDDTLELIVCAVPYLRDRDLRTVEAGESIDDKERKILQGVLTHYRNVVEIAKKKCCEKNVNVPIIAMGHLFTAGGQTIDGDGVRELYIGSLAHVTTGIFPEEIDYLALGHLHVPQKINHSEFMRYSGSPIAMGFGEAHQEKSVCLIEFNDAKEVSVNLIKVPVFQCLRQIKGDWNKISQQIQELSTNEESIWLEIAYDGEELIADLRERLENAIAHKKMEILRVKNNRIIDRVLSRIEDETLDDLNVHDVFERCLAINNIPEEQRPELLQAYKEIVNILFEEDRQAE